MALKFTDSVKAQLFHSIIPTSGNWEPALSIKPDYLFLNGMLGPTAWDDWRSGGDCYSNSLTGFNIPTRETFSHSYCQQSLGGAPGKMKTLYRDSFTWGDDTDDYTGIAVEASGPTVKDGSIEFGINTSPVGPVYGFGLAFSWSGERKEPSFYIPDRHLRAPELLIPNRKPVVPVEVDTEHWAGKHLHGMYWNGTIDSKPMQGAMPAFSGARYSKADGWDHTATNSYFKSDTTICPQEMPFVLLAQFKQTALSRWGRHVYLGHSHLYNGCYLQVTSGDKMQCVIGDGTGADTTLDATYLETVSSISANTWYTAAVCWYASGGGFAARLSINGAAWSFTYPSSAITSYDGEPTGYDTIGRLEFATPGAYYYSPDYAGLVATFTGADFSQQQLDQLSANPYQILKPRGT